MEEAPVTRANKRQGTRKGMPPEARTEAPGQGECMGQGERKRQGERRPGHPQGDAPTILGAILGAACRGFLGRRPLIPRRGGVVKGWVGTLADVVMSSPPETELRRPSALVPVDERTKQARAPARGCPYYTRSGLPGPSIVGAGIAPALELPWPRSIHT
ncbi:MAG: hypothetical protein ACJ8AG_25400 [Ktedonobacteraceae bacterium]